MKTGVVILFALLLGVVTGSAAAPDPTAPAAAPAPSVTVTVNVHQAPASAAELRDPFVAPVHQVAVASADDHEAQGLQNPFDAAHLAARETAPATPPVSSPFSGPRAGEHGATRTKPSPRGLPFTGQSELRDPFAT